MHRLSGKEAVKKSTADDILALLYAKGAMSRKDIASVLNLSRATLTVLSSRLIEQGLLIEKGKKAQENGAGRREILLDINVCYQYVMAVTIESSQAVITVCNLKASPIDQNKILLTNNLKPKELLSLIAHQCQRMLKHHDIALSQLLGLGFSLPGFVNRHRGTSMHCHALWQDEVDVRGVMEDLMGCSVIIENNIKSFAEGELLYGLGRTASNILFIKWGPGVGATMVINGRLYEGGYSKTMDLAHYIVDDRENSCWCGRIGCLEA